MDETLLKFGLTAFITLLVVVDPFGVLPIFLALVRNRHQQERARIVTRSVLFGFIISLSFLVLGHKILAYLGVTVHAFSISGGILLFATALPMLFGQRPGLQSAEESESGPDDIAIFPLAIPLLAGPGTITSILLLTGQAHGSFTRLMLIAIALALVFFLTRLILGLASERLMQRFGQGGLHVATRVLGILLAALAVQFVLNGVGEYIKLLHPSQ